jgi:hypothetical protein
MSKDGSGVSTLGQDLFSLEDLYRAYRRCRRRKRNTLNALRFEQDLEENLVALHEELTAGTYRPGRAVAFLVEKPKRREIFAADFEQLPAHKTLFKAAPGCGLPIGNLTSQFFANVYLDALDQFVKHQLKARYYLRYCDDLVLLSTSPAELAVWEAEIESFLSHTLHLTLNDRRRRRPVSDGIDFLGYIVRPDYVLVRRRW